MSKKHWLTSTVVGIGVASFFSDLSHEAVTSVLPQFLASPVLLGSAAAAAAALGSIEGVADGLSCAAKIYGGWLADRVQRRKVVCAAGYSVMALAPALIGAAVSWPMVLAGRCMAWVSRGIRSPARKALMAEGAAPEFRGRAFGVERMMDTLGAVGAPLAVSVLIGIGWTERNIIYVTAIPALLAALAIIFLVRETPGRVPIKRPLLKSFTGFSRDYYEFLAAVLLFGSGDFAKSIYVLYATAVLTPKLGVKEAAAASVLFYALYNTCGAVWSYAGGWLADKFDKRMVLALGYACATAATACMIAELDSLWGVGLIFSLAGTSAAMNEAVEDAIAADLVSAEIRGSAYGALAVAIGAGDMLSSIMVGWLWSVAGPRIAFSAAASLMVLGTLLVLHLSRRKLKETNNGANS